MKKLKFNGYMWIYLITVVIALAGIILGDYRTIPEGLKTMYFHPALLITDYIALVGPATAFLNVALVTLFSALLMQFNGFPLNGNFVARHKEKLFLLTSIQINTHTNK